MSVEQATVTRNETTATTTGDSLRSYAATGSPQAFDALVRQYVNLVYTAARRQAGGDAHLADDITQAVFIVLSQKARAVPSDRPLSAWLMKVTRYCANNARRMKQHRETHERRAGEMARDQGKQITEASWEQEMAPLLDEGLSKLRPADRDALLLKFFEHKSLREVGEALGVSEEAAQKRVTRAVDRLRDFFRRRGAAVAADSLAGLLAMESIKTAPTNLAASIGTSAAAGTSTTAATLAKGAIVAMATQKTTAVVIGGLVLLLGIGGGAIAVHSITTHSSTGADSGGGGAQLVDLAPAPANAVVSFADGTKVECVGMSDITFSKSADLINDLMGKSTRPLPAKDWWKPDGSVGVAPELGNDVVYIPDSPGNRPVRLVFDTTGPSAAAGNVWIRLKNTGSMASSVRSFGPIRRTNMAVSFPETVNTIDISVGMAKGPWRTDIVTPVVSTSAGMSASTTQPGSPVAYGKIFDTSADNAAGCSIEMLKDRVNFRDERERGIRVTTTDGKELWCSASESSNGKTTYHFTCPKEKLANIVWLSRPYEWATMSRVSLKPSAKPAN